MSQQSPRFENSTRKAMLAGSIGGLAGTVAMSQFQKGWRSASQEKKRYSELGAGYAAEPTDEEGSAEILSQVATLLQLKVRDRTLDRSGVALHYIFGVAAGAIYGALQESRIQPERTGPVLKGAIFGVVLFLGANEFLKLMLKSSSGCSPLGSRRYAVASHVVYGVVTAEISGWIRRSL